MQQIIDRNVNEQKNNNFSPKRINNRQGPRATFAPNPD